MRRKLLPLIFVIAVLLQTAVRAAPEITAPSAVLTDAGTGITLYEKNADKRMFPASTTKIMTAILAIENGDPDEILTTSAYAVNSISYDSSKADLIEGEQMSCKDLIYALIIASANDAAIVLAEYIGGSTDGFVKMMNEKAAELGATGTHYVNPHGLHDDGHYTTARDLAIISKYAMGLPMFRDAVSLSTYKIAPTNKTEKERTLTTTNMLLNRFSSYYYQYATGIKTGYTSHAGYCLVSSATKDKMSLICVVMGAEAKDNETLSFVDTRALLRWALGTLSSQSVCKKGSVLGSAPLPNSYSDEAILEAVQDVNAILPEGKTPDELQKQVVIYDDVKAPVNTGDILGRADFYYNGSLAASTELASVSAHKAMPLPAVLKPIFKVFRWPGSYIILGLIIIFFLMRLQRQRRINNVKKKRAQMRAERKRSD